MHSSKGWANINNATVLSHWTWHNRRGHAHRLERVPAKPNFSDALSRFEDIAEARQWMRIDLPLSTNEDCRRHNVCCGCAGHR